MAPFHIEWFSLALSHSRLCIVAPRGFSKSETFSVNLAGWSVRYDPGLRVLLLSLTEDLAVKLGRRLVEALTHCEPQLIPRRPSSERSLRFTNGATVDVAGVGAAVRGAHPDLIIADDVLSEESASSELERKRTERWFQGSIAGMAHPDSERRSVSGRMREFPPTRIAVVGTPFHDSDLLMHTLRRNVQWEWRRYAAEFEPDRLPLPGESLAVQLGAGPASARERPDQRPSFPSERHPAVASAHRDPDGAGMQPGQILGWKGGRQPFESAGDSMRRWGI
jgi:hypothetical protein